MPKKKKITLKRPRVTFGRSFSKLKVQLMIRDKETFIHNYINPQREHCLNILFQSWLYFQNFVFLHACLPSCSVVHNSLQPFGLYPSRLLSPWDSPGKNIGVSCHASPRISPNPEIKPVPPVLLALQVNSLPAVPSGKHLCF